MIKANYIVVSRHIRKDLKFYFPNAEFKVLTDTKNKLIEITWLDFPMEVDVKKTIAAYTKGINIFYNQKLSRHLIQRAKEALPEHLKGTKYEREADILKEQMRRIYEQEKHLHETLPLDPPRGFPKDQTKKKAMYCIEGRRGNDFTIRRASEAELKKRDK